jgi:hypothetical protein
MTTWSKTSLEPITPVRFRCGFGVGASYWRRGSVLGLGGIAMRTFICLILPCLLFCGTGCFTHKAYEQARGPVTGWRKDDDGKPVRDKKGNGIAEHDATKPGYYCLFPLTIPLDVATSPIQLTLWAFIEITADKGWEH